MAEGDEYPSGALFESTVPAAIVAREGLGLGEDIEGVDLRRLRGLVHQRVFGGEVEAVEVGRYLVLERLGSGGMGVVFSAFDRELDRKVALKLLHDEDDGGGSHHARLLAEARALARLSHPNVVQVHDVGEIDGRVYVAMEFVAGATLREWVRTEEPDTRAIVDAYVQAGRGLAAAHRAGIIHRDFKPDNVLVGRDGRVRVLDFGISRAAAAGAEVEPGREARAASGADEPAGELRLTRTGALLGTIGYMAPEQFLGAEADARSDQFGFCVSLYESLYRARPFAGETYPELVNNVLGGRLRALDTAKVPRWLRELLTRGLSTKPELRYPSMDALLDELGRDRLARRRRLGLGLGAVALAGLTAVVWAQRERSHAASSKALATVADSESARADAAERELIAREDAVTLAEASLDLADSPGRALARLRGLSDDPKLAGAARILASDAARRGLPERVVALPAGLEHLDHASDGGRVLLGDADDGALSSYVLAGSELRAVELRTSSQVYALSPGAGRYLALLSDDGARVTIRDLDGDETRQLTVPPGQTPRALELSPDGRVVAGFAWPRAWLIGPAGEAESLAVRHPHELALLPGDAGVVLRGEAGRLIHRTPDGELRELAASISINQILAVSPTGDYVAALSTGEAELVLAPLRPGLEPRRFATLDGGEGVLISAWAPLGTHIALGGADGSAVAIEVETGARVELPAHEGWITSLAFSADGAQLASASFSGSVFVTGLADGEAEGLAGHRSMGWVHFDGAGTLHSVDFEGVVRTWDTAPRHQRVEGQVGMLRQASASKLSWSSANLIAVCSSLRVAVLDAGTGELRWRSEPFTDLRHLAWSPDGGAVAAATFADGRIHVWAPDGSSHASFGDEPEVTALGFVDDDELVWAVAGGGLRAKALAGEARFPRLSIEQLRGVEAEILSYDPSRAWLWLAGTDADGRDQILAIDPADADAPVFAVELDGAELTDFVLIPGRDALAYATTSGQIYTLALDPGAAPVELGRHRGAVQDLDVDGGGATLYSASLDGSARVWDLASGRWRPVPAAEQRPMAAVAVAPDGRSFVAADLTGELRIWPDALPREWSALRGWIADQVEVELAVAQRSSWGTNE